MNILVCGAGGCVGNAVAANGSPTKRCPRSSSTPRSADGLAVTPPRPAIDARVELAAPIDLALRMALAFVWIYTAAISAWWPARSGVLDLLARCGFAGSAGYAALAASCALNVALGTLMLLRPSIPLRRAKRGRRRLTR